MFRGLHNPRIECFPILEIFEKEKALPGWKRFLPYIIIDLNYAFALSPDFTTGFSGLGGRGRRALRESLILPVF